MKDTCTWKVLAITQHHLDDWVGEYLGELALQRLPDGTTRINGVLSDIPAVYGFIIRLRDGGIPLLSLHVEQTVSQEEKTQ